VGEANQRVIYYDELRIAEGADKYQSVAPGTQLDHLVLYRPGHPGNQAFYILRNQGGQFSPVFASQTGIDGYDLMALEDRAFAFDYNSSGKPDHLVLYRPGLGTIWILRNNAGAFTPVYREGSPGNGIGGYDLADPADRAFAFDY
jgi:hypothetical protein